MLLLPQTTVDPTASTTASDTVCTVGGCVAIQDLLGFVILVSSGLLGLIVGLSYLATARDAVSEERRRVEAEQNAFGGFARRVAAIDPTPSGREATAGGTTLAVKGGEDGLEQVRQAYRDTVMAVDHYEDDYDEPLAESLAEEFGPDVATAVVNGPGYSPTLQAALVDGSRSAIRTRQSFLEELEAEAASLSAVDDVLADVRSTVSEIREAPLSADFDVMQDRWERLEKAETACIKAVQDRHRSLDEREAFALAQYLYDDLPIPAPVLAEAGRLVGSVRTRRRQTEHLLSHLG